MLVILALYYSSGAPAALFAFLAAETSLVVMGGIITSFLMAAAALGTMLIQARKSKNDTTIGTLEVVDKRLSNMVDRYEKEAMQQRERADKTEAELLEANEKITSQASRITELESQNRMLSRALTAERQLREEHETDLRNQIARCSEEIRRLKEKNS